MFKRFAVVLIFLLFVYIINAFLNPYPAKSSPLGFRPKYGVSYSFEQAGWYGYDPRAGYTKLLDEVKFDWVRLPFFWDQMTDKTGKLKIDDLEFAVSEAEKRNIKVIIALGSKVPYYPEYHVPQDLFSKIGYGQTIKADSPISLPLLTVDNELVSRLFKYNNIIYWQIENEPFLPNVRNLRISQNLLQAEVDIVRKADIKKRPIILTSESPTFFNTRWQSLFTILKPGDVYGTNVYFKTQGTKLAEINHFGLDVKIPWPKGVSWPVQSWYFLSTDFEKINEFSKVRGVSLWAIEVQAEPYIRALSDAKAKNFDFKPADIAKIDAFLKSRRIESVGLWGANFWLYRQSIGDDSWIDTVKEIVN